MQNKARKLISSIKKPFLKKVPTPYPLLQGEYLKGRSAFITGGNSGIGFEIAKKFLENGASSIVIAGRNIEKNKKALAKLEKDKKYGSQSISYITIDLENIDESIKLVKNFLKSNAHHKTNILVNCAGIGIGEPIGKTSVEDYERVLKVNLEGTYFLSQEFYNYMVSHKISGNILNVLSSSSARPATTAYICSKWAERGLTIGMAKKFIKDNIVVNAIAPGPTATDMLGISPEKDGITLKNNPSGRYAMPQEIANLAVILTSDLGKLIVGDVVYATGGAGTITVDDITY